MLHILPSRGRHGGVAVVARECEPQRELTALLIRAQLVGVQKITRLVATTEEKPLLAKRVTLARACNAATRLDEPAERRNAGAGPDHHNGRGAAHGQSEVDVARHKHAHATHLHVRLRRQHLLLLFLLLLLLLLLLMLLLKLSLKLLRFIGFFGLFGGDGGGGGRGSVRGNCDAIGKKCGGNAAARAAERFVAHDGDGNRDA
mmetsp:Transcript_10831/g.29026  ORF Transcript_10831/g.29026 Transcript_10831/m.29026 type:complete len:202 (-) Transcript_10831:487-1092(-)